VGAKLVSDEITALLRLVGLAASTAFAPGVAM